MDEEVIMKFEDKTGKATDFYQIDDEPAPSESIS